MDIRLEYDILCLKNKLQTNLKYHLLSSNKPYHSLNQAIDMLKNKYNSSDNMNELERLRNNVANYSMGQEFLRVEDWISNWKNKLLIDDLLNFVDTHRNYQLEEKIEDLQRQIYELKSINLEQNPYIIQTHENTSK